MLRVAAGFLLLCVLLTLFNAARADGLVTESIELRNGQLLVMEESTFESRSVCSCSDNGLTLQVLETLGCAGPLVCDDIGDSRWDWPETVTERSDVKNAE